MKMFSWFNREREASIEDLRKQSEKYYIKKSYKENFGIWLTAGGIYPSVGVLTILFTTVSIILVILFGITVKQSNEIATLCESVHFIVMLILEITALVSFAANKETIDKIYWEMGRGFHDYENTLDEGCQKVISEVTRAKEWRKKVTHGVFVTCLMCTVTAATVFRPLLGYIYDDHTLDDGIERLLPVPIWSPFGKGKWYGILFLFLAEDVVAYITPGIVFGCILFVVCTCEDLGAQLIILGHTLKSVTRRADCLKMPRDEAIKLCFKHSIRHHQTLIKFGKNLETVIFVPGFGLFFGSTIMMCMSGFMFVSKEVPSMSKVVFCFILLSELAALFIICSYGEYVQQASVEICNMVYASEWTEDMKTMKSYVLIIQLRSRRPIRINFCGFMVASLETYANICSSAFSYFNLMIAVN